MKPVVGFGEIMCRLACPQNLRLRQSRELEVTYAGAEASVCASICNFGGNARYVTALPQNALAEAALDTLRAVGIDTTYVLRSPEGRMGLYFLETGANQRPSKVLYDRADAAVAITSADAYNWVGLLEDAGWLHLSGITPALSETAANATKRAAAEAKRIGLAVSIDLNFRKRLWGWSPGTTGRELARRVMSEILPDTSVVIANEEDCADVLGIEAGMTDVESGSLEIDRYPEVAKEIVSRYPNIKKVAITLRESASATHNNWGAMLYDADSETYYFAPLDSDSYYKPYEIKNIVDRVGGGDSFAGGLIFALNTPGLSDSETAIKYAAAASCLKHSIKGDFNFSTRSEVEALMSGAASGRVIR